MKYLFFFALFFSSTVFAQNAFPLLCKGGYTFRVGRPIISIQFKASTFAAGETGEHLLPGTCAWIDRPLNNEEPRILFLNATAWMEPHATLIRTMFLEASMNRNCVIESRVRNDGGVFQPDVEFPIVSITCF